MTNDKQWYSIGATEDKLLKMVSKVRIDDIPVLKRKGYNVKIISLGLAMELFGDEVLRNSGDSIYVSLDVEMDYLGLKTLA